jgi:hypothetical protein
MTRKAGKRPAPKVVPIRPVNVSKLAREHGVHRSTIRDWMAKGKLPVADAPKEPPPEKAAPPNPPPPPATPRHPLAIPRLAGAAILAIAALGIAALALAINAQYGASIGETALTSWTFMGLATVVDLLAVTLPPAAIGLWRTRQRGLAIATWLIWGVAAALATFATVAYLQKNLADTSAARAATITTATTTADQRAAIIAASRLAVDTARTARESECGVRGPRCLQREVEERTAVSALTAAVAAPIVAPARIADPDPQIAAITRLAAWVGVKIGADDVSNIRLVLWALLLNAGGLVLAFALGLCRVARTEGAQ